MESTAAATAYGLLVAGSKQVLVFDMGGGTTDISIVKITEGGLFSIEMTGGHGSLGGMQIDNCLYKLLIRKCQEGTVLCYSCLVDYDLCSYSIK